MRRVFPILALVVVSLWVVTLVSLASHANRVVVLRGGRAAWGTLGFHVGVLLWLGASRFRPADANLAGWIRVQESKHRRKGAYLAIWGLAVLGLCWWAIVNQAEEYLWPGREQWFGVALSLGFQPGMMAVECLTIAAHARLIRSIPDQKPLANADGGEL